MTLAFRRKSDSWNEQSPEQHALASRAYYEFLDQFDHHTNRHLFEFFGWDFFHDGEIKNLHLASITSLIFDIMNPSIHRKGRSPTYAWFRCEFENVVWMQQECAYRDELNDPLKTAMGEQLQFNISEINGLSEQIEHFNKMYAHVPRTFSSLVIDCFPGRRRIGLVFQKLNVQAHEPVAFDLLRENENVELHLYKKGKGSSEQVWNLKKAEEIQSFGLRNR